MQDNENIETFSARRRIIHFGKRPEMLFFEPDELDHESDEVPFIRVDDLFSGHSGDGVSEKKEKQISEKGKHGIEVVFTLILRHSHQSLNEELSKIVLQSLAATSFRESIRLLDARVRPVFIQWKTEIPEGRDPQKLVALYRRDLEYQLVPYRPEDVSNEDTFWADDCLILPAEKEMSMEQVMRFVNKYQKEEL